MAASGARLVEVGTTNRTGLDDYRRAMTDDTAARPEGPPVQLPHRRLHRDGRPSRQLAGLGPPVVADIGSGLLDAATPWLAGGPPAWLARRAGGPPDARGRGRPRHLLRRQAARRPPGRHHRRSPATWSTAAPATRSPGPCGPGAWCSTPSRPPPSPTCAGRATPSRCWAMATIPGRDPAGTGRRPSASARPVRCASVPGGGSLPGWSIPSAGVTRPGRPHRRPPQPGIRRSSPGCTTGATVLDLRTVDPADDVVLAKALGALPAEPARRRHRRPRRPRQVDPGPRPHRHRPGPLRRGEGARPDHRPRLRLVRPAVGPSAGVRGRARPRPLHPQHAGRRGGGRRLPLRGGGHRGLEAAVRGAPPHPQPARHPPRPHRPDQGGPGRRRVAGAGPHGDRGAGRAGTFLDGAEIVGGRRPDRRSGSTTCGRPSTACSPGPRPRPTATGPACGSTAPSRPRARAPS